MKISCNSSAVSYSLQTCLQVKVLQKELCKAKNATKPGKDRVEALEAEAEEAVEDREGKCERELPNAPNTDLADEMNHTVRIQHLVDTRKCAAKHFKHKRQMDMAEREPVAQMEVTLQQLLDVREQARFELPSAIAIRGVKQAEAELACGIESDACSTDKLAWRSLMQDAMCSMLLSSMWSRPKQNLLRLIGSGTSMCPWSINWTALL
jgi:hypothetical protein